MKRLMFVLFGAVFLTLVLVFFPSAMGAGSLSSSGGTFTEDWESNSFATNDWSSSGGATSDWVISTDDPFAGTFHAQAENSDSETTLTTNISTAGHENISFSFQYDTDLLDAGEYLRADWYNGTDWINILNITGVNTGAYTLSNNSLGSDAADNSAFAIRFRCNSGTLNEACKIDDVAVTGTAVPDTTFPLVFDPVPINNSEFNVSDVIEISANVTDDISVDTVIAISLYLMELLIN